MLPEFSNQLFQLPLITTAWTNTRNRYRQEKQNSFFPIRFILTIIEQTIFLVHQNVIRPLPRPYHTYLHNLDQYLCSHVNSIRHICPIVDQTSDEVIEHYGDIFFVSIRKRKSSKLSVVTSQSNGLVNIRKENKFQLIERSFQFVTKFLVMIEMYSKSIQHELNDYMDTTRNLWKNLNMEDGRSLDEVESFSEKLLVLGRRMTGNYRQLGYLMGCQLKRCRYILFSFLHVQNRFRSTIVHITRKIQITEKFNTHARHGLIRSKECVHHYLERMMVHAAGHPWMKWITPQSNQLSQPEPQKPLKFIRPIFFVSSNNTSDCSGSEDNLRDQYPKIFESTPYRRNHQSSNVVQPKTLIEDVVSNISSSSPSVLEPSFDVKDILRQVQSQSQPASDTSSSIDQDDENQIIELALNESDVHEQQQQQPVSVFDLSPMLASGCAV